MLHYLVRKSILFDKSWIVYKHGNLLYNLSFLVWYAPVGMQSSDCLCFKSTVLKTWSFSSLFITFHHFLLRLIAFHPFSSLSITFHPFSIPFYHFSSLFIPFHPFSSRFITFHNYNLLNSQTTYFKILRKISEFFLGNYL